MKHWLTVFSIALGLCACFAHADDHKSCSKKSCKKQNWLLFGDSLFDTGAGNTLALEKHLQEPNPQPPYSNNRHCNGPIWVDYASQLLDAKVQNFAVAGAETGAGNFSVPGLGGIFQQIDRYKKQCPKIGKNTLVIMDGGANNLLALLNNPADLTPAGVTAAITTAIGQLGVDLTNLQELGAKKIIIWNMPDIGKTPEFTDPFFGLTAAAPLFTAASEGFNAGLLKLVTALNTYAKDRKQVFILDTFTIFNQIEAELRRQGINTTAHTLSVIPVPPFIIVNGPPPNDIAFYDNIHPTTFLWQIAANTIGAHIDTLEQGPRFIAVEQDLAFATAGAHRDAVNNHYRTLHLQHFSNCCPTDSCCGDNCCGCGFQFYADTVAKWGNYHSRCGTLGSKYDTQLGLFGVDYQWNDCLNLGTSFTYQHSFAHTRKHRGHMELNDYIPTVYATLYRCNTFVDADFSYHFYHYNVIKRHIPFLDRTARAHTNARGLEGNIEVGYVANCNCWTLIPIAGLGVEGVRIDNYKEKGADFLSLKVRRQHQNSFYSKVGAQFWWNSCDCCYTPFGEIMYEHEFDRSHGKIAAHFVGTQDHSTIYSRTGESDRDLLRFTVGLDARFTSCLYANVSYQGETTFRDYTNGVKAQFDFNF